MKDLPCKILVCDDDHDILEITGILLEYEGFNVVTQIDSSKIIDQARLEQPDVMLIDIWMPLPGNVIVTDMKRLPELAHIPIILFSAEINGRAIAEKSGAEQFIEKPFDIDSLVTAIHSLIKVKNLN